MAACHDSKPAFDNLVVRAALGFENVPTRENGAPGGGSTSSQVRAPSNRLISLSHTQRASRQREVHSWPLRMTPAPRPLIPRGQNQPAARTSRLYPRRNRTPMVRHLGRVPASARLASRVDRVPVHSGISSWLVSGSKATTGVRLRLRLYVRDPCSSRRLRWISGRSFVLSCGWSFGR
jgi:hypothetical protein